MGRSDRPHPALTLLKLLGAVLIAGVLAAGYLGLRAFTRAATCPGGARGTVASSSPKRATPGETVML
jgi:hypothetical protein